MNIELGRLQKFARRNEERPNLYTLPVIIIRVIEWTVVRCARDVHGEMRNTSCCTKNTKLEDMEDADIADR
jgi:hypothetical protein